jgi:hypothetical protein
MHAGPLGAQGDMNVADMMMPYARLSDLSEAFSQR